MQPSSSITRHSNANLLHDNAARGSRLKSSERHLQDVFSAVLEQVGREGYVAAEPVGVDVPLANQIGSSWDQWFLEASPTRYSFEAGSHSPSVRENKSSDDLRSDYKSILNDAYAQGGYASPKSFLNRLSQEQLATIQQVQHLADPIQITNLSEEAALNLLLPPAAQIDANQDGMVSIGAAQTVRFPDSQTPANVRDAWEAAVANVSPSDRFTYELMMTHVLSPFDSSGPSVPKPSSTEHFIEKANDWLSYLENFKSYMPIERYHQDKTFWSSFRDKILNPPARGEMQ